jgi:Trk K+ transport system NAD-binding subunit
VLDTFLVCGLGSLGQNCVIALKKFGVKVVVIEKNPPPDEEIRDLLSMIDLLLIGDCSDQILLQKCKMDECRAALIVTTSESVNVATAIAIRQLNQKTRLVMRSNKENLNHLLSNQLGNFIAYEPTELSANVYALSALGKEILGFFSINEQKIRIIQEKITANHSWCNYQSVFELNSRNRRIISCHTHLESPSLRFYEWNPDKKILVGDTIILVETEAHFRLNHDDNNGIINYQSGWLKLVNNLLKIKKKIINFWKLNRKEKIRGVGIFASIIVLILLIIGTLLFKHYSYNSTYLSSFYVTAILLLGGYADLFGTLEPIDEIPQWLQLFSLILTLTGTAFVGILYALLTESLLSAKFQFTIKKPPIPTENHIVIVGFGRIGQKIAYQLKELKQSLLAISFNQKIDFSMESNFPLIVGNVQESLKSANLDKAKSVVIVTDNDITNLEVALMIQNLNPRLNLVIRTNGDSFTYNLHQLLPQSHVFSAYQIAAEAFTAAAFGENILQLYRFEQQNILLTEYEIEAEDTLNNLLIGEIAYGYGVIPIFFSSRGNYTSSLLPSDDILLTVGDRLIVLATIDGLKSIEKGDLKPKQWQLEILSVKSDNGIFEGANAISRITGCPLKMARQTMENLPQVLPVKLYHHQIVRLKTILQKNQVRINIRKMV